MSVTRDEKAKLFRSLHFHHGEMPLVLLNAWDAASAAMFAHFGAPAIGLTSTGLAHVAGYAQGEQLPAEALLKAVAHICDVTDLPVSVDIEDGLGATAEQTAERACALLELGVVGLNIEDGVDPVTEKLRPPQAAAERIAAIRARAERARLPVFINARTDTYLAVAVAVNHRFEETVSRVALYQASGADGAFVPGLSHLEEIAHLVRRIDLPLNIDAGLPNVPTVGALALAGVRRVSVGSGLLQAACSHVEDIARELLDRGTYHSLRESLRPAALDGFALR